MKFTGYVILLAIGLPVFFKFWWKGHKLKAPLSHADLAVVASLLTGIGSAAWLVWNCVAAIVRDVPAVPNCNCPSPPLSDNQLFLAVFMAIVAVAAALTKLWERWQSIVAPPPPADPPAA